MKTIESKECGPLQPEDRQALYETVGEERRRAELIKELGIKEPVLSPSRQEAYSEYPRYRH